MELVFLSGHSLGGFCNIPFTMGTYKEIITHNFQNWNTWKVQNFKKNIKNYVNEYGNLEIEQIQNSQTPYVFLGF